MQFMYLQPTPERAMNMLGFLELREAQRAPIEAILHGHDVIVVMPTGGGKSGIFQISALCLRPALTLVFSPLKALQADQVNALRAKNIDARLLNSSLSAAEREQVLQDIRDRKSTLLYLAPEQLHNPETQSALLEADIGLVVLDEAHTMVDSFRKAYGQIGSSIDELERRPVIAAFTATASKKDRKSIAKELDMQDPKLFINPIRRGNLHLYIKRADASGKDKQKQTRQAKQQLVRNALEEWDGNGSVIIYCPTVKEVKRLHKWLKAQGVKAGKYHGKQDDKKRAAALADFLSGEVKIMVVTNAFGLGIDKLDVRLVIHAGLPLTIDGYVQEIGRAGRDGKDSKCVLIYSPSDFSANKTVLTHGAKKKRSAKAVNRLGALKDLIQSDKCLWQGIENHFSEKPGKKCGKCCKCLQKK